jgi:crotonobetainyl-CoA:carnitine CoA-transferase CaiB-like acyl-CoA transferase
MYDRMKKALDGIQVLDLSRALAGPYCTMMLADMGAEVIKVEMPGTGDDSRAWGPPFVEGESAYFMSINRNKKSITLDMKGDKAIEIIMKLIKQSDVLVENFRPGAMERLGLAYQQVKAANPRLVYCSISGFGQNGPYRMLPGFDQVLQGMGGLMSITGEAGGPPVKVGVPIADITAGMFAAYGIAIALFTREKTGRGQMVDISLLDGQVALLTYRAGSFFASGEIPERIGSGHPVIVPYQAFKAKDVFINIAVGNDQLWGKFCKAVGLETIMNDPRFATNAKRVQNRDAVVKAVGDLIATKNGEEWLTILTDAGIPCGPIYTVDKIFSDPQIIHRQMVTELQHPTAGTIKVTGNPVKLSDTPGEITMPPPLLGQHTREVLEGLGYSAGDIEQLRQAKII